jgi:hypothetical protein
MPHINRCGQCRQHMRSVHPRVQSPASGSFCSTPFGKAGNQQEYPAPTHPPSSFHDSCPAFFLASRDTRALRSDPVTGNSMSTRRDLICTHGTQHTSGGPQRQPVIVNDEHDSLLCAKPYFGSRLLLLSCGPVRQSSAATHTRL